MATFLRAHRSILALVAVAALAALMLGCGGAATPGVRYHCPMHPTFIADKPGDCPICGMRLVPIREKLAPTTVPRYVCPMHPDVTSDRPGRCPECGMPLVAAKVNPAASATADPSPAPELDPRTPAAPRRVLYYRSPMNPSVTSPVPMKDEMGMDYVPVYADEVQPPSSSAIPGLAAIQLTQEGIRLAGVLTAPAVEESLARTIRTVGTVTADETRIQHFHTRVTGFVTKLYVNFTGEFVKKGQPVLSLYSPELLASQEELLRARDAEKRFATSDLPEVRKGGEELLEAARRRLRLFDVPEEFIDKVERTGAPQRDVTLLANATGYVTSKGIFQGQQVDPSMMDLFTITDLSHVWIDAQFYEYEASLLRLGQQARLTLAYDPALALTGRIAYIYPTLDTATRTVTVRFDFANPGLKLKPGMFANVELETGGERGVVIPDSAIIYTGERQLVFVSLGGGRFEPRQVRVGVHSDGKALVLSGVAAGEQVVVKANFLLDSESQLRAAIAAASAGEKKP